MRIPSLCCAFLLLAASAAPALVVRGDPRWVASADCPPGWMNPNFDASSWEPVQYPWMRIWPKEWPKDPRARPFWEASGSFDACARRVFHLDGPVHGRARAHVWVDDDYEFYLNGILVANNDNGDAPLPGETYDVGALLRRGDNVVALHLHNRVAVMGALFSLQLPGVAEQEPTLAALWRQLRPWAGFFALGCCAVLAAHLVRTRRTRWARPLRTLPPGAVAALAVALAATCQALLRSVPLWEGTWDQPVADWNWPWMGLLGALLLCLFVVRAAAGSGSDTEAPRGERALLLFVLLLAALLRVYRVDEIPVGFYQDESTNANDALALADVGGIQLWSESVGGRPTLFLYMLLGTLRLFGESYLSLKILPVCLGVATVAALYGFTRTALGPRTALWAAFFLAVSRWHIHYSRMAWEAICVPLFLAGGLGLFLAGLRARRPQREAALLALAAVVLSAGLYTYAAYRAVPVLIVVFLLATWRAGDRGVFSPTARRANLLAAGVLAFAVALPLATFAWQQPALFWERYNEVSLPGFMRYYNTPSPWLHQLGKSLFSFNGRGDELVRHNLPFAAHLDPLTGVLFLLGLATPATVLAHRGMRLLWAWFLTLVALGSLTLEAPHATRLLGLAPAAAVFAAFGTVQLLAVFSRGGRRPGHFLIGASIAAVCLLLNAHAYFVVEANHPDADYEYDFTGRVLCEYLRERDGVDVYWTDDIAFWADGQCRFLAAGRYTPHDLWIEDIAAGRPVARDSGPTVVVVGREFVERHAAALPLGEDGLPRLPFPGPPSVQRDRRGTLLYYLYSF